MICPDCGEVAIMKKYEVYCPRCGLVLDDTLYSFEHSSESRSFVKNHAVISKKKKKAINKKEKKIAATIVILKKEGNGLPAKTIENAILIVKKGLKYGIFDRIDKVKICRAALYVAAKNDYLNAPFKLKKKERQIAKLLELFIVKETDPSRKLDTYISILITKMATGFSIDTYTIQKIQEDALKLIAHGCAPKNAVAAAFYVHAARKAFSITQFSKKCGVSKNTVARLVKKLNESNRSIISPKCEIALQKIKYD